VKQNLKTRHVNRDEEDFSARFGRQLKSKGGATAETFFFHEDDDPRLRDSLEFFFGEQRPDLDRIRAEYQEQRPHLAAILRKKAKSRAKLAESKKRKATHSKLADRKSGRASMKHKIRNFKKKTH
jgi:hypothetical protein